MESRTIRMESNCFDEYPFCLWVYDKRDGIPRTRGEMWEIAFSLERKELNIG